MSMRDREGATPYPDGAAARHLDLFPPGQVSLSRLAPRRRDERTIIRIVDLVQRGHPGGDIPVERTRWMGVLLRRRSLAETL
jgi:transposase